MNFGIILTARCNASCLHCSKSYGPYRTETPELVRILRFMKEAAALDDPEQLGFDLTGGEPFLDFERLLTIVRHGAALGAEVSCVTNAYWARTDEIARSQLTALREAGLTFMAVSVSRFHQEFVPLARAQRTLKIAAELGISTELKGAVTNSDTAQAAALDEWKRLLDADKINIFPVLPFLREDAHLPESEFYREPGLPRHTCPGEEICVYSDTVVRSCCGPGVSGSFLAIGDLDTPVRQIRDAFLQGAKQEILRRHGPIYFAEYAIASGLRHRLRDAYAGPCDLCVHISKDLELRRAAEEVACGWTSPQADSLSRSHRSHNTKKGKNRAGDP